MKERGRKRAWREEGGGVHRRRFGECTEEREGRGRANSDACKFLPKKFKVVDH